MPTVQMRKMTTITQKRIFCPLCGGRRPNVQVYFDHGHCFKCGKSFRGKDFQDLLRGAGQDVDRLLSSSTDNAAALRIPVLSGEQKAEVLSAFASVLPMASDMPEALRYFEGRGIEGDTIREMRIRYVQPGTFRPVMAHLGFEFGVERLISSGLVRLDARGKPRSVFHCWYKSGVDSILFPYLSGDRVIYIKGRSLLSKQASETRGVPRYLNISGTLPLPYNANALQGDIGDIFICEGEVDTLTLLGHGYSSVGIPSAGGFKRSWTSLFKNCKRVLLALDSDEAGQRGAERIATFFADAGMDTPLRLPIPSDSDINSLLIDNELRG